MSRVEFRFGFRFRFYMRHWLSFKNYFQSECLTSDKMRDKSKGIITNPQATFAFALARALARSQASDMAYAGLG